MLKVAVTGGIGSGKTLVCNVLRTLNVPIFNSDLEAKALMHTPRMMSQIKTIFGIDAYVDDQLNRRYISDRIFVDDKLKSQLERIVHPAVRSSFSDFCDIHCAEDYVVIESAILYKGGLNKLVDKVIYVDAPVEIRIGRVSSRDGLSIDQIKERIAAQSSEMGDYNYLIVNDNMPILDRILEIDKELRYGANNVDIECDR